MKTIFACAAAAASLVAAVPAQAADIVIFGTGLDAAGNVQANGASEIHYTLRFPESPFASTPRVATSANGYPIGPWLGDNATSAWIGPVGSGQLDGPVGTYTYTTTFSLAGLNASTASLTGRWATDDGGWKIVLNGNDVVFGSNGFTSWSDFTINSGFVAGDNTLEFLLDNGGGPTGLRVEIAGTAALAGAIPEPATWALLILGFGVAGAAMRRQRKVSVSFA